MKKSVKVRVTCLIVAALVLGSAMTVAAVLGSPYETLKNAMLDVLYSRNATEEGSMTITVNGVLTENTKFHNIQGDDSSLKYWFDQDGNVSGFHYASNGLSVYPAGFSTEDGTEDGTKWYCADIHPKTEYYFPRGGTFSMYTPNERNSARLRFFELLLDALVGDLKNNITMTSENNTRYIQGTLTESQIPEIAKAGIDVLIEQSGHHYGGIRDVSFDGKEYVYERAFIERDIKTVTTFKQIVRPMTDDETEAWERNDGTFYEIFAGDYWGTTYIDDKPYIVEEADEVLGEYKTRADRSDYESSGNPLNMPMESLVVNYVHGKAEVDNKGNLLFIDVVGTATSTTIFGDVNVIEIKITSRFSDIGTSSPICPIPGVELLFTPDYTKLRFGYGNVSFYFMLNEQGTINMDSVTSTRPSETISNYGFVYYKNAQFPSETRIESPPGNYIGNFSTDTAATVEMVEDED